MGSTILATLANQTALTFGLLGPVEAWVDGREVPLGGPRARAVLAALLLEPNRVVPLASIVATAWGDEAPDSARFQAQNRMSALRRALRQAGGQDVISTAGAGYVIHVRPGQLDVQRFDAQVEEARRSSTDGDLPAAAQTLTAALQVWRGPALHGMETPRLLAAARRLDDARLAAREQLADIELRLGHHQEVIAELHDLVTTHPWREGAAGMLMLALYRTGRRREALETYDRTHHLLTTDLGIDPGTDLIHLRDRILRDDPDLIPEPAERGQVDSLGPAVPHDVAAVVPRQLPAVTGHFVGRADELSRLDRIAATSTGATPIASISGTAGVGKTALAVYWAHRVADRFPAGQLYVNLRGFDPTGTPVTPAEAIRGFLDALAVEPRRIPVGLDAQAALYRSLLAERRMLVVLDNARHADQVRPLLPATPTCLVLVTSRDWLTSLTVVEDAQAITLDLLAVGEAMQLLTQRLGSNRITAEPEVAAEIVERCARLPLALAIVAARAAAHSHFPLTAVAKELRETRSRLDVFAGDDAAIDVRAVFSWSYQALSADAARLFRQLGLHPGPDISVPAAASLAGVPVSVLRPWLAELTRAHLIAEHRPGRYTFHDLLRAYAAELAHTVDSFEDREAAVRRVLDHYLHSSHAATWMLLPNRDPITLTEPAPGTTPERPGDHEQALSWFAVERDVLLAAAGHAIVNQLDSHIWQFAWTLADFFNRRGHWRDNVAIQKAAVKAAGRLGDLTAQSRAHRHMASAYIPLDQFDDVHTELQNALETAIRAGNRLEQAHAHHALVHVWLRQERHVQALEHARAALELHRAAGHRVGQADTLNAVGWCHAQLGDFRQALECCEEALRLHQELANVDGQAETSDSIGYIHLQLGDHPQAVACYEQAVSLLRGLADRHNEAAVLLHLADAHRDAGQPDAARDAYQLSLDILVELNHPGADMARARLEQLADSPRFGAASR